MFFSQIFVSLQMYAPIMLIGVFGNNLMAGQYKIVEQIIVILKRIFICFSILFIRAFVSCGSKASKKRSNSGKLSTGLISFSLLSMAVIYLFSEWCVSYFTKTNIVEISTFADCGIDTVIVGDFYSAQAVAFGRQSAKTVCAHHDGHGNR
jgi:hypothetical protein